MYFLFEVRLYDYNGTNWKTVIYSDGRGYYEYLRSAFITKDLSHQNENVRFVVKTSNGRSVIKYFAGTAIAESPFFAIACLQSIGTSKPLDGYEYNFQRMIVVAGFTFSLIGLFFTNRLLHIFHFNEWIKVAALLLIMYGTNLFYYAILEPSMSHVYSFATIAAFLYSGYQYFRTFRFKYLLRTSFALGLTILIRPTNGVILLMLPFLCGGVDSLTTLFSKLSHVAIAIFILAAMAFIQIFLWHEQCGQWFIWSYQGEGFYFSRPEILNFLFSFRKGFFVYTPLALIAMVGLIPLYRTEGKAFISILITLLVAIYINSCWWDWNYGDSFGMRPMIDFYSLIAILIAIILSLIKRWIHALLLIPVLCCFGLTILQSYQYYNYILQHYSMNKEKYRYVFLKTDEQYRNVLGGNIDLMRYTKEPPILLLESKNDMENTDSSWMVNYSSDDRDNSGEKSCFFDQNEDGLYFVIKSSQISGKADRIYIESSLRRYEFTEHSSSNAVMEASVEKESGRLFDYQFRINDYPDEQPGHWRTFHYAFSVPIPDGPFDNITIQIRNPAKQKFLIDDWEVRAYGLGQK